MCPSVSTWPSALDVRPCSRVRAGLVVVADSYSPGRGVFTPHPPLVDTEVVSTSGCCDWCLCTVQGTVFESPCLILRERSAGPCGRDLFSLQTRRACLRAWCCAHRYRESRPGPQPRHRLVVSMSVVAFLGDRGGGGVFLKLKRRGAVGHTVRAAGWCAASIPTRSVFAAEGSLRGGPTVVRTAGPAPGLPTPHAGN